ncbi:aminoacyl-tRNA hydrolase [Lancefieldella rimae]|uniref:aminoacyl-tRNA hydrolase n=1 Tax=Lancefieldella rimae TaxID=1383 RepID=UPI001CB65236|nr:aminoacyl-tRNA hydrolase [Lancefieldella rimae]MBF4803754.1 aminoacyl-tRNA hydrolase [Lancefieldella rimae]
MSAQRQTHHGPRRSSTSQAPRELLKSPTLICGLGNPGEKYAHTRHNIGFAVIDALARRYDVRYWKSEAGCLVTAIIVTDADAQRREVLLAKPQDFMNTSGGPLSKLARARRISPADILVVHDEVDLAEGRTRVRAGGGLNAHNGLRSIADKLGTRDFMRLQCGIGRPPGRMTVADYVLRELKGTSLETFCITAEVAADEVEQLIRSKQ